MNKYRAVYVTLLYPENPFDDAKIQQSKGDLQIGFPAWGVEPPMREIEFGEVVKHVRSLHFQSAFLGNGEAFCFGTNSNNT